MSSIDSYTNEYSPSVVFPPGDTIRELLEDYSMTQEDLAKRMSRSPKFVSQLVGGKAPLNEDTAIVLERIFNPSAVFWLNLESTYRTYLAREKEKEKAEALASWTKTFPLYDIKKLLGVSTLTYESILSFFKVGTPESWEELWGEKSEYAIACRGATGQVNVKSLATWLRFGQLCSEDIDLPDFDKRKIIRNINRFRKLTLIEEGKNLQDETKALCAEYGIVLLFIPEFKGTKIYGATHWYMGKPIIQLSLRQKSNDHLWFSFFHELKHVLSHSPKRKYINNNHDISSKEEREANLFASEILIPTENYNQFIRMRKFGVNDIREFAQHLGVHPGIVVGRLQHDKIIPYSHRALNRFKVRYTFVE